MNTHAETKATQESTRDAELASARTYRGSCHCGAVRFECVADLGAGGSRCNCSICTRTSVLSGIVKPDAFSSLVPEERLSSYEWGAKISRRFFCKQCGV